MDIKILYTHMELNPAAFKILACLYYLISTRPCKINTVRVDYDELMEITKFSRGTIAKGIRELEEKSIISKYRTNYMPNEYMILK